MRVFTRLAGATVVAAAAGACSAQSACLHFLAPTERRSDGLCPALGDLDGDGDVDLLVVSPLGSSVWTNDGRGSFFPHAAAPGRFEWAELADFDGDGSLDALAIDRDGIWLLRGDGLGRFAAPQLMYARGGRHLVVADMNADGRPDVVTSSGQDGDGLVVTVFRNRDGERLSLGQTLLLPDTGSMFIAVGDLDGDGRPDVVVPRSLSYGLEVYWNAGTGGLLPAHEIEIPWTDATPVSVAAGDFDGDGLRDIVASFVGRPDIESAIVVVRSLAGRTFEPPQRFTVDAILWHIACGDVNGDGRDDVVGTSAAGGLAGAALFRSAADPSGRISILPALAPVMSTFRWAVRLADVDGSGSLDVISTDAGADEFAVARNISPQGVPCFPDADEDFFVGAPEIAVVLNRWNRPSAITDFNADGTTDAADLAIVLSFFGMSIAPEGLRAAPRPTYDTAMNEAATAALLEAADVNNDGRTSSDEIARYLGNLGDE